MSYSRISLFYHSDNPEKLNELRKVLYSIDDQMVEPLWPSLLEGNIAVDYTVDKIHEGEYETVIWEN